MDNIDLSSLQALATALGMAGGGEKKGTQRIGGSSKDHRITFTVTARDFRHDPLTLQFESGRSQKCFMEVPMKSVMIALAKACGEGNECYFSKAEGGVLRVGPAGEGDAEVTLSS